MTMFTLPAADRPARCGVRSELGVFLVVHAVACPECGTLLLKREKAPRDTTGARSAFS